jgi:hypothetical protein
LHYLGTKNPVYRKYAVYQVELHGFEYKCDNLKGLITNEERYDLSELESIFELPWHEFNKIDGKRLVGCIIRICKTINKPEHADVFNQIVEGCFTLYKHQDPSRFFFDLYVEPSTGGIQCNCCQWRTGLCARVAHGTGAHVVGRGPQYVAKLRFIG